MATAEAESMTVVVWRPKEQRLQQEITKLQEQVNISTPVQPPPVKPNWWQSITGQTPEMQAINQRLQQSARSSGFGKWFTSPQGEQMLNLAATMPMTGMVTPASAGGIGKLMGGIPQIKQLGTGKVPPIKPPSAIPQSGDPLFNEAIDDLINKILPAQKVARIETKGLYTEARKPAFAQVEDILTKPKGEETVNEAMKALKTGTLPRARFDTELIQNLMTQPKKDAIINNLATNPNLVQPMEKFNAMIAMKRILSPMKYIAENTELATKVPVDTPLRNFELKLFEKAWGKDNADRIAEVILKGREPVGVDPNVMKYLSNLPSDSKVLPQQFALMSPSIRERFLTSLGKVGVNILDALGIPKAMVFSGDFSMMFRQLGLPGLRHPIAWLKTWKYYVKAFRSEELAMKIDREMMTDPDRMMAIKDLALDLFDTRIGVKSWMARPESMASRFAERYIPGVRISNRSAAIAVNFFMTEVGKGYMKALQRMRASQGEYKAMGELLNWAVGRGTMPKQFTGTIGDVLNKLMSSPRYFFSRWQFPAKLASSSKAVRQEAASMLVLWAGANVSLLGMAKAMGAEVELDPRSPDAYKIKIGNKRIDIWVGYAQIIRLLAQLAPYRNSQTGEIDWTMGSRKTTKGEIVATPRSQILSRYAQSKESPGIGTVVSLLEGKTYTGEKIMYDLPGLGKVARDAFTPATIQEMVDAYVLEGTGSAVVSGLGLGGVGVSTYTTDTVTNRDWNQVLESGVKPPTTKKRDWSGVLK